MYSRILTIVFFFAITTASANGKLYEIDPKYPVHDLSTQLQLLKVEDQSLTIEEILKDTSLFSSDIQPISTHLEIGAVYWGKIILSSSSDLKGWKLNFEDRFIGSPAWIKSNGKVDVFGFSGAQEIFHKKTGVEYSKAERDVNTHWILNQVSLDDFPTNTNVTLLIRVEGNSFGFPPFFNLSIRSPQHPYYHQIFEFNNSFNLFMLGVTFIIFLYHLLQYIYLRQSIFLWFSLWLLFCTLTMAMATGFIIGNIHHYRLPFWMCIANGVLYSFWFFGRSFISSKEKYPKLDRFILGLSLAMIAEIFLMAIYIIFLNPQPYLTGVGIHYKMIILYSILSIFLSITLILKKDYLSRYFGFGAIIVSIAFTLGGLWSDRIIRIPFSFDPYAWGIFLQIIIYSFGIAYRQRMIMLRNQKEQLLSQQVQDEVLRMKDLDEIKTLFFTNISHEFRTPLSLITGPLDLAKKNNDSIGDQIQISKKTYDVINRNARRLQELIDQLLELSKIDSGKIYLKVTNGDLVKFLKSVIFSFESISESKNISMNVSFPESTKNVFFDEDKLEKIITNLMSNAFKYTPDGGVVTVSVEYTAQHYIIEISDTGKGMSKDEVKKIFDRFYRVAGTEEKGTGIGLALTKELIDLQNGQVSVTSRTGKGTTFKVRIPHSLELLPKHISIISEKSNAPKTLEKSQQEIPQLNTKAQQIISDNRLLNKPVALLVEDNADLRTFISDILHHDYKVIIAEDGQKGERLAFEHIPDIIISDIMMPKKDGYQLCNTLKNNSKTSHIPIIILTAKAGHENKIEGLTQGADAYLTKPFNAKELLLYSRNAIQSRQKMWNHFNTMNLTVVNDFDLVSVDDKFIQKVFKTIRSNIDNEFFSVEDLAKSVGFSRSQLHRKLKALCNKSANQLIIEIRLNEAKIMLEKKQGTVSEIAYSVGYSNMSYFTKSFKEKFGLLPSKV